MCFVQTVKFISPPGYGNYEDYGYNDGYGYGRDGYGHNMRAVGMMDRGMNLVLASVFFLFCMLWIRYGYIEREQIFQPT